MIAEKRKLFFSSFPCTANKKPTYMSQQAHMSLGSFSQSQVMKGFTGHLRPNCQRFAAKKQNKTDQTLSRTGLSVHLLACLRLASILQRLCHVDFRSIIALQQQDEGLEAAQAVALGS